MLFQNKRAVSPLVATIILVLFSLLLGTVTMNLGKNYIEGISSSEPQKVSTGLTQQYIGNSLYQCTKVDTITNECLNWELAK